MPSGQPQPCQPRSQSSRGPPKPKFVKDAPDTKPKTQNLVIRPPSDFLWVDYQDDKSQGRELSRSKQAFVRTRHHRMRREKQLQQFKTPTDHTPPPPSSPSLSSEAVVAKHSRNTGRVRKQEHDDEGHYLDQQAPILITSLEAGVLDGGPALAIAISQNPNIYFQHCEYARSRIRY